MTDPLCLYDQKTESVRQFEAAGDPVTIYVCGITPYDATHFGHAFTFVGFDVLMRYLRYRGYRVRYVQNVTDIDDPLFAKARELGVDYRDLARRETEQYESDMTALNVASPDVFPRASEELAGMIELIQRLFAGGHAYEVDSYVYFPISTDENYGQLSHLDRAAMIPLARERGGAPDDPRRRDPLDFLLWRPSDEGEPAFESPWGPGLPGWHLECSTMALRYLGMPLDIHGGGADLVFPHHENEIAQSEAVDGSAPFARFWIHTGMVYLGGRKMSKSLGNMVFIRHLLPEYSADAIRLYISSCHYRADLHYDAAALDRAAGLAEKLSEAASLTSGGQEPREGGLEAYRRRFEEPMNDDLDTPGAIAVLQELAEDISRRHDQGSDTSEAQSLLRELGTVLGLQLSGQDNDPIHRRGVEHNNAL